jgi:hypothetical protein
MAEKQYLRRLVVPSETLVAEVAPWPDEVWVAVYAPDGNLTVSQAIDLAHALLEAAEDAPHLDWSESTHDDAPTLIDDRV